MIDNILIGFEAALSVENLIWCFIGVFLGTVIGILPGLGSATGVAILIPVTLTLDPLTALIMLAGIYHGSQYGATITAILIATPGGGLLGGLHVGRVPDGAQRKGGAGAGDLCDLGLRVCCWGRSASTAGPGWRGTPSAMSI